MPLLSRSTGRLLRTVSNQPHAGPEDHEEDKGEIPISSAKMTEEDINAEPRSSNDDEPPPEWRASNIRGSRTKKYNLNVRAPSQGAYMYNADVKRESEREKENQKPKLDSGEKRKIEEVDELAQMKAWNKKPKERPKSAPGVKRNIFADPSTAEGGSGSQKTSRPQKGYSYQSKACIPSSVPTLSASQRSKLKKVTTFGQSKSDAFKKAAEEASSTDDSEMEDLDLKPPPNQAKAPGSDTDDSNIEDLDFEPPRPKTESKSKAKVKGKQAKEISPAPAPAPRSHIADFFAGFNPRSSQPDPSGTSTPSSSMPNPSENVEEESLETLGRYLAEQAPETSDDQCPLCYEPVPENDCIAFFSAHSRTSIRDQQRFCRQHNKRKAQEEYDRKYPTIDWIRLPNRIRNYFPLLISILQDTNLKPSFFRSVHADSVKRGEDRTILKSNSPSALSLTGYYGGRGARLFNETLSSHFEKEIRDAMYEDEVVRFGGFGNFVQRVLVPELSTRLVMEDFEIGEEVARGILEKSGRVGSLVNEEVDDIVEKRSPNAQDLTGVDDAYEYSP